MISYDFLWDKIVCDNFENIDFDKVRTLDDRILDFLEFVFNRGIYFDEIEGRIYPKTVVFYTNQIGRLFSCENIHEQKLVDYVFEIFRSNWRHNDFLEVAIPNILLKYFEYMKHFSVIEYKDEIKEVVNILYDKLSNRDGGEWFLIIRYWLKPTIFLANNTFEFQEKLKELKIKICNM